MKKNAIVGQSGGPTAAINATLAGVISGAMESDAIETLYGALNGVEGMLADTVVNLTEEFQTEEAIKLLMQTPAAALGSCRKKLPKLEDETGKAVYEKLFRFFEAYKIGYFFYIGGNDSMDTVAKLTAYAKANGIEGISFIGVPKTIDNDLDGTSHTPGFGSAAKYIAATVQEILRDTAVYTVKAVTIVEIMGRDAGWLTASAALSRLVSDTAPDLVYLPEVIFDLDRFYADLEKAFQKHPNVVVCVSEGIRFANGSYVGEGTQSGMTDAFGHKYLQGTGKALELLVKERFGCKVRSVELSLPQRCAAHILSDTDIRESFGVGKAATVFAKEASGVMIGYVRQDAPYEVSYRPMDVLAIANKIRSVPREFINEAGNNVTDQCLTYLQPLIEGEYPTVY
ncbi:MAG: 6-phosphofructokinase, partial [Clostridia bacterium]|nr:6-phosphofructokinase [Clostridia bacterium]